mmetsp:Transcript_9812/g.25480  ORF Transcript_9812/g.25480 Transcript_9812/m.25480 type:complete len:482 (-) Transcript_9812:385-1830(-)
MARRPGLLLLAAVAGSALGPARGFIFGGGGAERGATTGHSIARSPEGGSLRENGAGAWTVKDTAHSNPNVVGFGVSAPQPPPHLGDVQFQLTGVDKSAETFVNVIKPARVAGLKPMERRKRKGETVFVSTLHLDSEEVSDIVYTYVIGARTVEREEEGEQKRLWLPPDAATSAVVAKDAFGQPNEVFNTYGAGADELWIGEPGDSEPVFSEPAGASEIFHNAAERSDSGLLEDVSGASVQTQGSRAPIDRVSSRARIDRVPSRLVEVSNVVFKERDSVTRETAVQVLPHPFYQAMRVPRGMQGLSAWLRQRRHSAMAPRVDGPTRIVASAVSRVLRGVLRIPLTVAEKVIGSPILRILAAVAAGAGIVPLSNMLPEALPRIAAALSKVGVSLPVPKKLQNAWGALSGARAPGKSEVPQIPKRVKIGGSDGKLSSRGQHPAAAGRNCPSCDVHRGGMGGMRLNLSPQAAFVKQRDSAPKSHK